MGDLIIRSAHDGDATGLITLIAAVFAEYPNCILDVDGEMPELRKPATAVRAADGQWWVAELDGAIVGSVSISPSAEHAVELKRLYVAAAARRRGLGAHLVRLAESEAAHRDAHSVFLWTDTRFADAHRLYERLGYARSPGTRALHDVSNTIEYHYAKELPR
jgi:N-acetylglutamate synthase-like GNAT family acetyltransferase